jgi:membrane protein required for colicin V production
MNAFDVVLIVVLVAGGLIGLSRGAMRIVIGIVSLFVAFILASRYQDSIASVLVARHVAQGPARVAAYVFIFLLTMIAGGLVAWLVGKMLKLAMLSWADRLAGAALGLAGALITAAFLVHPIAASAPGGSRVLAESKLAPYVSVVADLCNAIAPDAVAKRYNQGMETLRKVWRGEVKLPDLDAVKKGLTGAVEAGEKAIQSQKKPQDKKSAPAQ